MILTDTAGIRPSDDLVEKEGISLARAEIQKANAIIFVLDIAQLEIADHSYRVDEDIDSLIEQNPNHIVLVNKSDILLGRPGLNQLKLRSGRFIPVSLVSLQNEKRDKNLELIKGLLSNFLVDSTIKSEDMIVTRHRHRVLLEECHTHLTNFLDEDLPPDMACEELRSAVKSIAKITGHIDVENVLDVLFRDFCIGK